MKRWTFENIIIDAKNYETKKEWYETPKSSYDAARSRGLLKNKKVVSHFKKTEYPALKWSLEKIIFAARKFNTRKEWREAAEKKVCNSYAAASSKGLLKNPQVVGHFKATDKARKWTYQNIIGTTKNVKTYKEWMDKFPYAYQRAYKTGVLKKVASHLVRVGHKYKRCIYSIEVRNKNMIYIGLTFNFDQRVNQHMLSKRFVKIKERHGNECLTIHKLSDYIPINVAAEKEDHLINEFKNKGFTILNKKKGGDLGSISTKWTKEKIIKSAQHFKTLKEWREKESSAYSIAKKKGYLKECHKFLIVQMHKIRYDFR